VAPGVEHRNANLTSVTVTHRRYAAATPVEHRSHDPDGAHGHAPSTIGQDARTASRAHARQTPGRRQRIPSIEYAIVKERRTAPIPRAKPCGQTPGPSREAPCRRRPTMCQRDYASPHNFLKPRINR